MSAPSSARARLDVVQILRGLAALMVVLSHLATALPGYRAPWLIDIFSNAGDVGVSLFFMISGVVVPWSLVGYGYSWSAFPRFMGRRLLRLDPPYFATLILGLAVAFLQSRRSGAPFPYSGTTIALHLGYLSGIFNHPWIVTVFWTLGIEFQFYILMGLVMPLLEAPLSSRRPWLVWTAIFAGVVYLLAWLPLPRVPASWLTHAPYFLLGFSVFLQRRGAVPWPFVAGASALVWWKFAPLGSTMWAVVGTGMIAIVFLPSTLSTSRLLRPLFGLGAVSYSLYLTHLLVIGRITNAASARGLIANPVMGYAVALVELTACFVVATGLYLLVERPCHKLSQRIRLSPQPRETYPRAVVTAEPA